VSPQKNCNENTKKIKIARNFENSHLPRSSRKWSGGRVSSRRPLSDKTAFVGNESRFCRSKRPRGQSFTEEFSDVGWVGDVVSSVSCRASLHLSVMHKRNFVCDDGDLSPPLLKVVVTHNHFFKVEFAILSYFSCYQKRSVAENMQKMR